ncbi:hypothetical protein [Arcicella rigui]|uniref:Uncharacterized protein n=1 Tax=Arcicella rigui TaxID=797020 RepID=A0ABU5QB38_9BACT|nr:hypothetical protein [Arcicella rigui]MEA5140050.1 hypothetical protein [Arcicella rigui]
MIKTSAVPLNSSYNLTIPNNYIGKKIEIIIYALDEVEEQTTLPTKTKLSEKYRGILSKEQGDNLDSHISKMRGEWNGI